MFSSQTISLWLLPVQYPTPYLVTKITRPGHSAVVQMRALYSTISHNFAGGSGTKCCRNNVETNKRSRHYPAADKAARWQTARDCRIGLSLHTQRLQFQFGNDRWHAILREGAVKQRAAILLENTWQKCPRVFVIDLLFGLDILHP